MAGEGNQIKWVGIRPTNPEENIPVKPGTLSGNFPITFGDSATPLQIATPSSPAVIQTEPAPWATSRSGVTRTQILKSAQNASDNHILHTVTSGKTLYITSCCLSYSSGSAGFAKLLVRNGSDTILYYLVSAYLSSTPDQNIALSFPMPISVAAGFDIVISGASGYIFGTIHGWEE
jgi:hypothetical protein